MDFIKQLRAVGCEPENHSDIILDDKPRYIQRAGDKRGQKRVSYCLNEKGGWVYDHKTDITHRLRANGTHEAELTREERAAIKAVREAEKAERERKSARAQDKLERALSIIVKRMPLAESHEYLARKGINPHGARLRVKTGELVIPARNEAGKIATLQKIKGKWKGYQKGGKKRGAYYVMAAKTDSFDVVVITEGFATGASLRESCEFPTVVAFDAGNILPTAQAIRRKQPNARIVFAADNDCWGTMNTGRTKAEQAAVAIGGAIVVWPEFETGPDTDWNDAHRVYGLEYVKDKITAALAVPVIEIPEATQDEAPDGIYTLDECNLRPVGGGLSEILEYDDVSDLGMNFRCLGYNGGDFYYYPYSACQIVTLSASSHSINNLLQLDDLELWESKYGGSGKDINHAKIALNAANDMMQTCRVRGVFMQQDKVRGCGAWIDDGRVVLHTGDALWVDGHKMHFRELLSEFTYVASSRLMQAADDSLNNYEARRLRTICEAMPWENKISGSLLAGWLVIAPICAALTYRPHIFITGQAESGKSTVVDRVIKVVLGKMALNLDGTSTEPSIRQRMAYDARPLVFDEAEPSGNMAAVIDLARLATTGGIVSKFGQPVFKARFCACFSGINPSINKTADESRITFMPLKKNISLNAAQQFSDLLALIDETFVNDYSERMIARTIDNMQALIANIRIFQTAARQTLGAARASQQIGTLLAGLYLLGRTDIITEENALVFIKAHNWTEHALIEHEGDPVKLVQHIASSLIRTNSGSELSIGDLIGMVATDRDAMAQKILKNYGIVIKDWRVYIASTSHNLARLLKDTDWRIKWSRTLSDVSGAQKEKCVYFSRGVKTSAISLPLELFHDGEVTEYEELQF